MARENSKSGSNPGRYNIQIWHHSLRDNVEKGFISMEFVSTNEQIADIFTKALNIEPYETLRQKFGMISLVPWKRYN